MDNGLVKSLAMIGPPPNVKVAQGLHDFQDLRF